VTASGCRPVPVSKRMSATCAAASPRRGAPGTTRGLSFPSLALIRSPGCDHDATLTFRINGQQATRTAVNVPGGGGGNTLDLILP